MERERERERRILSDVKKLAKGFKGKEIANLWRERERERERERGRWKNGARLGEGRRQRVKKISEIRSEETCRI